LSEIFVDHLEIAIVEGAVELRQCLLRLAYSPRSSLPVMGLCIGFTPWAPPGTDDNPISAARPNIAAVVTLLRDSTTDIVSSFAQLLGSLARGLCVNWLLTDNCCLLESAHDILP
jgi:hypothetical protein